MFNTLKTKTLKLLITTAAALALTATLNAAPKLHLYASGGTTINSGQTTISLENLTDFGQVGYLGSTNIVRYFYIRNIGPSSLQLSQPAVTITQSGSDFTITPVGQQTLAYYAYTFFSIKFDPSSIGVNNATVHIASNDPSFPNYSFAIQGSGVQFPTPTPMPELSNNTLLITKKDIVTKNGQTFYRCSGTMWVRNNGDAPTVDGTYLVAYADADGSFDVTDVRATKPVKIKTLAPQTGITRKFKFKIPAVPTDSLIMRVEAPPAGDSYFGNNLFFGTP